MKATWHIIFRNKNVVLIQDDAFVNDTMSVTNDAEAVVEYLIEVSNEVNKRIFYIDTDFRIDELGHDGVKFTSFTPGNWNSIQDFIAWANKL